MTDTLTRPIYDDLSVLAGIQDNIKAYDAQTLTRRDGSFLQGQRNAQKDTYTDYFPSQLEKPNVVPFKNIPTLPTPEPATPSEAKPDKKKRVAADVYAKQVASESHGTTEDVPPLISQRMGEKATEEETVFKPFGHFGMPFNTSSGSEIGFTPHPQVIMARTLDDCTHTMAVGRATTTKTITKVDHLKQDELGTEFDDKLKESIETAKKNQHLSYIQNAIKCLTITVGIGGGIIVSLASANVGSAWSMLWGLEMTAGGLLELGSFCLDQIGYGDSTWTSLTAIGGAVLAFHGGLMGSSTLFKELPSILATSSSVTLSLLNGYGAMKKLDVQAAQLEISGGLTTLSKEKKNATDTMKKHYGALNIKDFAHFFKAATTFVHESNQAARNIIQGTLKG